MKSIIIILFLSFAWTGNYAQTQVTTKSKQALSFYQEAISRANRGDNFVAIDLLNRALGEDPNFIEAQITIGELYSDTQKDSLAIEAYKKAISINPDFFPAIYSNLANLEFNSGKYESALEHVKKYLTYKNLNETFRKSAEILKSNCEFAIKAVKSPVPFHPRNLGTEVNDKYDQYWPSVSADEKTLIFTDNLPIDSLNPARTGNRQEDFYYSISEDGKWEKAMPVGYPLNTSQNEGAQSLSADGKFMVFTGCNRRDGIGNCDLYYSRLEDGQWSKPVNMGKPVNTSAKETQPSISADGKTIYFASNRPGGKGGLDIWKTELSENGTWSNPENLGDSVNTPYDEQSPFIHPDNKTLYFSSKGWPGMGRADLFVTQKKSKNEWKTPKNLGYPINTNFEEAGMVVNAKGTTAYYSSNRLGGFGGDDIYSFDLPKEVRPTTVSYMKGNVFDANTKASLAARFELTDLSTGENVMDAFSNQDGSFLICLPEGKDYALNVNRPGYLFYSDNFNMEHGDYLQPFTKDIPLKPLKVGEKVVMKNVFFDIDSYVLKPQSKIELDRLVKLLKDNPTIRIEISGHTDNTGKADHNLKLSESRAKAVADYLLRNGVKTESITSKGYGASQPMASNDTEDGRAQNRRTEFKVLKI